MIDGCIGCTQQLINANAKETETLKLAAEKAETSGEAQALYRDGEKRLCFVPASDAVGYPIFLFVTPEYKNANLRQLYPDHNR